MAKLTINHISIENFGPFLERQKFDLTVQESRPVVLLKALNGSGKTTLLTALQVGLYGYKSIPGARRSEYEQLISGLHRQDAIGPARIEMKITIEVGAYTQVIDIRREWTAKKGATGQREIFKVFIGNIEDSAFSDEWDDFINGILPIELVNLFLFDGEKIEALANPDKLPALLKRATEVFLGLGGIDGLVNDLRAVERRAGSKATTLSGSGGNEAQEQATHYQTQLEDITKRLEILTQKKAQVRTELDLAQRNLEEFSIEAQRNGLDAYERAAELKASLDACKNQWNEASSGLANALEDPLLPLVWLGDLWPRYESQWHQDRKSEHARLLLEEFSKRDQRILDMMFKKAPQMAPSVSELLQEDLKDLQVARHQSPILQSGGNPVTVNPGIAHAKFQLSKMKKLVISARISLDKAQQAVDQIPAKEQLSKVFDSMRAHTLVVSAAELKLQDLGKLIEDALTSRAHIESRYNSACQRLRDELKDGVFQIKTFEAADRAKAALAIFKERLLASKAQWLSDMITTEFQNLLHKKNLISRVVVEPKSYAVSIQDTEGHCLPMERLSAGERQILAIAVLSALIRERKGRFPVVVDTPLARLDRTHRESLIRNFFATVSHQVLVLSTDEEVEGSVYTTLQQHMNRELELIFDDHARSSSVITKQEQFTLEVV